MDPAKGSFSILDYMIFAFMLIFSAGIGLYYRFTGGRQKTNKEYFLADKNMPITPVAFSLMASFMSAITLLGVASENYMYGTQFLIINVSYVIGTPIAAFIFLPVFFQMQATSAFEYLEKRFNRETRLLASCVFILQMALYMAIVLYAPALTLSAVTSLPKWISVISIGIVCTFYCTFGGIKAVLWTDLFQSLLMFSAIFAVIAKGTIDIGGFSKVWEIAERGERIQFFNFDPDPTIRHTVWTLAIGGVFLFTSIYGVNQAQVQRLLTVKNLRKSQIALFVNLPITALLSIGTSLAGIVVYANLANCDPLLRSDVTNVQSPDQILPYFVMASLSMIPGLPGLFVAGIFSGTLSTMSSAINSLAAVTVEDFFRPLCFRDVPESRIACFTKVTAFSYGLLCIGLTVIVEKLGGVLQASLTIFNVVGGPMLGLFSLGMLCSRANAKGSVIGFLFALCLCFWIGFGSMLKSKKIVSYHRSTDGCLTNDTIFDSENFKYNISLESLSKNWTTMSVQNTTFVNKDIEYVLPLYKVSYMWYAGIGWSACVIVGLGVSLLFKKEQVNPVLLSPLAKFWNVNRGPLPEEVQMNECR